MGEKKKSLVGIRRTTGRDDIFQLLERDYLEYLASAEFGHKFLFDMKVAPKPVLINYFHQRRVTNYVSFQPKKNKENDNFFVRYLSRVYIF